MAGKYFWNPCHSSAFLPKIHRRSRLFSCKCRHAHITLDACCLTRRIWQIKEFRSIFPRKKEMFKVKWVDRKMWGSLSSCLGIVTTDGLLEGWTCKQTDENKYSVQTSISCCRPDEMITILSFCILICKPFVYTQRGDCMYKDGHVSTQTRLCNGARFSTPNSGKLISNIFVSNVVFTKNATKIQCAWLTLSNAVRINCLRTVYYCFYYLLSHQPGTIQYPF